jgi:hypothetical protein
LNALSRPVRLRDGRSAIEFLRCNPHWGGVSSCDTADGIPEVLTDAFLNRLVRRRGVCILYTHLGKRRVDAGHGALNESTRGAFRRLAERQSNGDVLVATTKRLLDYRQVRDRLSVRVSRNNRCERFELSLPEGATESQLQGLTFYTDGPARTDVWLNGRPVAGLQPNPADETGRASVSVRWTPLEFPHA